MVWCWRSWLRRHCQILLVGDRNEVLFLLFSSFSFLTARPIFVIHVMILVASYFVVYLYNSQVVLYVHCLLLDVFS